MESLKVLAMEIDVACAYDWGDPSIDQRIVVERVMRDALNVYFLWGMQYDTL